MSDPAPNRDKVACLHETCADDIMWRSANGTKMYGFKAVEDCYTNFFKGTDEGARGFRTIHYEYSETFAHGPVAWSMW